MPELIDGFERREFHEASSVLARGAVWTTCAISWKRGRYTVLRSSTLTSDNSVFSSSRSRSSTPRHSRRS